MSALVGVVLALTVCGFATLVGFDRERAFYPTVTIVIASYYGLFAVMGGSTEALIRESVVIVLFLLIAVIGYRRNLWFIVVALAAHGLLDLIHGDVIVDPGVPRWWPMFCLTYDLVTAAYLAGLLLLRSSVTAASRPL